MQNFTFFKLFGFQSFFPKLIVFFVFACSYNQGKTQPKPEKTATVSIELVSGTDEILDNCTALFSDEYSVELGSEDIAKNTQINENIAIDHNGTILSTEGRPSLIVPDTLQLKIWQLGQESYKLRVTGTNFSAGSSAFVQDAFTNSEIPVDLSETEIYSFSVTADPASFAADRFSIRFETVAILPIVLSDIKAHSKDKGVQVEWTSATETNMDRYEVESSVNGVQFKNAATITARSNNATNESYTWFDAGTANGNNFYRVKAISKSGEAKYSAIVKVAIGKSSAGISVFPNPVHGQTLNIRLYKMEKGSYKVALYNLNGQKVFSGTITHAGGSAEQTIKVDGQNKTGVFNLKISNENAAFSERVLFQ